MCKLIIDISSLLRCLKHPLGKDRKVHGEVVARNEEIPSRSAWDNRVGARCARVLAPLHTSAESALQAWIQRKQQLCGVADAFLAGLSVASSATRQGDHQVGGTHSSRKDSPLCTGAVGDKSWSGLARTLFFFATLFTEAHSPGAEVD